MMDGSGIDPFLQDVLTGLARDQKTVPSRWLYDARGSRLFDDITELDEYYPTRTELTILNEQAAAIAEAIGPDAVIVEYGAGSLLKVRILLDALERPKAFVPVDISSEHLKGAADELKSVYGDLDVYPVAADFMDTNLGSNLPSGGGRRAGFFPGSTMGNLLDKDIDSFLRTTREDLGDGACFIIGLE
ncbi:MAG: L-histidine N(alpha)-methyltransferase, partial [Henriciella sp.]|nr:L-histidine N(alpha)-methyltransferase [Henriciella sp.]